MIKKLIVVMISFLLCFSISEVIATSQNFPDTEKFIEITDIEQQRTTKKSLKETINQIKNIDLNYNENDYLFPPQPKLGGNEIFGLWINIVYKGNSYAEQISIDPVKIKGHLSDPDYRTKIKFNVDDDPEDDLEAGFGFFKYGIDTGDGSDYGSWATAFDVRQINNYLDDQDAELEIWQEFHVNLKLITSINSEEIQQEVKSSTQNTNTKLSGRFISFLSSLIEKIRLGSQFLREMLQRIISFLLHQDEGDQEPTYQPLEASEDYIVTRIGYRSVDGEKIPVSMQKIFAVAKENIFRPFIFQHEVDPNDIIGTDSNDVMFGFQAFREGEENPAYDVEFAVTFDPAAFLVTQFTPRLARTYYYYHSASSKPLDITFHSNILKGGDVNEEEEGSLSLTLSLDSVPNDLVGIGRWMSFDIDAVGDGDPFDGIFHYAASNDFNVGITVASSKFEEKIKVNGIPKTIDVQWHLDVDIQSFSMLRVDVDGFVEVDMSSPLNEIVLYYPKFDPEDEDMVFAKVSGIPNREKVGGQFILYVDPENLSNPSNYVFAKAYRDFSDNLQLIQFILPFFDYVNIEITDIPAYAAATGMLNWNRLQGYARAERYSDGPPDPIFFEVIFDNYSLSNTMEIRDGIIQTDFKIAEIGYFGFDTSREMFGDTFHFSDTGSGSSLSLLVDEVSADDLFVDWDINTSGDQLAINDLDFNGVVDTMKNLHFGINLEGKSVSFDGDWTIGESGSLDVAFYQSENLRLDFNLDNKSEEFDFNGHVILTNNLEFDIQWDWKQGASPQDPGYFKINENHNTPNLQEIELYFTYKDQYGVDAIVTNAGLYVSLEWWIGTGFPNIWLVFDIYGSLDLHLLWDSNWYYNVEDW